MFLFSDRYRGKSPHGWQPAERCFVRPSGLATPAILSVGTGGAKRVFELHFDGEAEIVRGSHQDAFFWDPSDDSAAIKSLDRCYRSNCDSIGTMPAR